MTDAERLAALEAAAAGFERVVTAELMHVAHRFKESEERVALATTVWPTRADMGTELEKVKNEAVTRAREEATNVADKLTAAITTVTEKLEGQIQRLDEKQNEQEDAHREAIRGANLRASALAAATVITAFLAAAGWARGR